MSEKVCGCTCPRCADDNVVGHCMNCNRRESMSEHKEELIKGLNDNGCPACKDCHILEAMDKYISSNFVPKRNDIADIHFINENEVRRILARVLEPLIAYKKWMEDDGERSCDLDILTAIKIIKEYTGEAV